LVPGWQEADGDGEVPGEVDGDAGGLADGAAEAGVAAVGWFVVACAAWRSSVTISAVPASIPRRPTERRR
jgi:hypothetical protein